MNSRRLISCFLLILSISVFAKDQHTRNMTLSLQEAILLAVRENPNVQRAQLGLIQQKFALELANWQFKPHYSVIGSAGYNHTIVGDTSVISRGIGVQPQATLTTPYGTQITAGLPTNDSNNFYPGLTLQVVQPLIKGFGRPIVEAALMNARDSERISRLNVENTLRVTVTSVINAYLGVVSAANTVKIDEEALKRSETSLEQTKLFIKSGRKAGVELVTVQADVANAKTKLENDKNSLDQARFALLAAIGIDPNTPITFSSIEVSNLIKKFYIPNLNQTKYLSIENDLQYQTDQITLQGATKRSIQQAIDNTRWQLNLTANATVGLGANQNMAFNNMATNQSQGAQLNLTIPIDDRAAKYAVANARIALRNARSALQQERWAKETSAINNWNTIYSAERAVHFAQEAEQLQQKTYKISFQKYSYGLIDSVELQSVHTQLINRQQILLDAQIAYLKALVNLDQQIGRTLTTWRIEMRCW